MGIHDTNRKPFMFPTYRLDKQEYAKIISEINQKYDVYKDALYGIHYSLGLDNRYYVYFFENHGFDEYNIYGKVLQE